MLNTESYSRVGWGGKWVCVGILCPCPSVRSSLFLEPGTGGALHKYCLPASRPWWALRGYQHESSHPFHFLQKQFHFIHYIKYHIFFFLPLSFFSPSLSPSRDHRLAQGGGLGRGHQWGTGAAHLSILAWAGRGRRRVLGRRPWHYGAVKAHNGD